MVVIMSEEVKGGTALFKLGYGLYVLTLSDGEKDNGLIVNTVVQLSHEPERIAVSINKQNYSHDIIRKTKKINVNCLTESAPFSIFEKFGFTSGREVDKFKGDKKTKLQNGLVALTENVNAIISLEVIDYIDLNSHGLFICKITEAFTLNEEPSMTYAYYHKNVKPKAQPKGKGYVCKICGYVYENEPLPKDFICPICKHPSSDFEKIK